MREHEQHYLDEGGTLSRATIYRQQIAGRGRWCVEYVIDLEVNTAKFDDMESARFLFWRLTGQEVD